jgi:prophage regulatory protein
MTAAKQPEAEIEDDAHGGARLRPMLTERMVLELVPLSRTTLYRLERAGKFPRSVYVSANRRLWFRDQIIAWQAAVDEQDERNPNRGRGKGRRRRTSTGPV